MVCQQLQCPSGCYRRFVILLAVPSPSFGQLLCPSRHFVHYFLRSASLHLVRSLTICCKAGHPFQLTKPDAKVCTCLSAIHSLQYSLGFTRCLLFGSPAAHFGCVHLAIANCSFVPHFAKHR